VELSPKRSWRGKGEHLRSQRRARVRTPRKIAATLKVEPSEIVLEEGNCGESDVL